MFALSSLTSSILGFSFFKTGDFEPKYNYFKPDENTLEIRLEVPGKNECITSHKIIGDETVVTVKGKKIKDNQPKAPIYNLFNIREFSDFELNIPLKVEDFVLKGNIQDAQEFCNNYNKREEGKAYEIIAKKALRIIYEGLK